MKEKIKRAALTTDSDVIITEVGGTVGDIESLPFLEALRQMKADVGADNVMYIHTTLLPYLKAAGEMKTKPTQHSVKELRGLGIQPNMLVIRTEEPAGQGIKNKLAQFCDVAPEAVIESLDVEHLYQIPLNLQAQGMDQIVCDHLKLDAPVADMTEWSAMVDKVMNLKKQVKISLVGKYVELQDAYISVVEALKHSGYANDAEVKINWINANDVTAENVAELLSDADGIIVPGGFGQRGTEGKIQAIRYARENDVPMLGVCLGMQLTCIEFAQEVVQRRHRHRYEFNNAFREQFEAAGFVFSGVSPDNRLVEIVEIPENKFFVACQYHPELSSRPNRPEELYTAFITAAVENSN